MSEPIDILNYYISSCGCTYPDSTFACDDCWRISGDKSSTCVRLFKRPTSSGGLMWVSCGEPVFDTAENYKLCLNCLRSMLKHLDWNAIIDENANPIDNMIIVRDLLEDRAEYIFIFQQAPHIFLNRFRKSIQAALISRFNFRKTWMDFTNHIECVYSYIDNIHIFIIFCLYKLSSSFY